MSCAESIRNRLDAEGYTLEETTENGVHVVTARRGRSIYRGESNILAVAYMELQLAIQERNRKAVVQNRPGRVARIIEPRKLLTRHHE